MSDRPSIVLVPGLLCDADIWRHQIETLSLRYNVICPGFMDHASIEAMADEVLAVAPERFSLAGHSMGGRVALEIVSRAPDRVERLALLDTGFHPAKPGEAEGRRRLINLATTEGMAKLAEAWLPPMLSPHRVGDAALMARLTAMVSRANPMLFQRQINALLTRPNAHRMLSSIPCSTAVIVGKLDAWSPPAQHEEMAACIPNAYLIAIEDCGHMSPVEQPEAITEALQQWMETSVPNEELAAVS